METIKITEALNETLEANNWVLINEGEVVATYPSRTAARAAKTEHNLDGKICKAEEVDFAVVFPAAEDKPAKAPRIINHESTVERPCKRVWQVADDMPGAKRKDVLDACVKQGIAYYTARTQYQQWLTVQKEMAEREAQQSKK